MFSFESLSFVLKFNEFQNLFTLSLENAFLISLMLLLLIIILHSHFGKIRKSKDELEFHSVLA